MFCGEFGLGLVQEQRSRAQCYGRHQEAQCYSPSPAGKTDLLQHVSQYNLPNCNLPTGKLVILLVFPCFLFSRELFLNTGRLNIGPFLEVLSAWSTLWNQCEQTVQHPNLPLFSPLFCTVPFVNTAQKLSDEDPIGIQMDYFFNCLPVGMDCLFLQRGQMIFITNEPKP